MNLPSVVAIIKCKAHKTDGSFITKGNALADEAAKKAAVGPAQMMALTQPEEISVRHPMEDNIAQIVEVQNTSGEAELSTWIKRGAKKDKGTGLWRSIDGMCVAPASLLPLLIKDAHGLDHTNRAETIRKIRQEWWSPYLASAVDQALNNCETCIRNNVRKNFTAPLGHIPPPMGPFRHLMMDYVAMGAENRKESKCYIFVVEDRFSRWVEATATSREDAKSAAKFLCREVIPRFGIPDYLSSDNGAHFVNQTTELITKALGIEHKLGGVYHPQSQGMVERANGILKSKLAKICDSSRLTWVQALPLALLKMRSQTIRVTHLTPHEMLTGRPMPMAFTRAPYTGPSLEQLEGEMKSYIRTLTQIHRHLYSQVQEAVHGEEGPRVRQIDPGDHVWIRVFKRKNSLEPRREGPFEVVAATPTAVKVAGRPHWYHLNHCSRGGFAKGHCFVSQLTNNRCPPVSNPRHQGRLIRPSLLNTRLPTPARTVIVVLKRTVVRRKVQGRRPKDGQTGRPLAPSPVSVRVGRATNSPQLEKQLGHQVLGKHQ
ncbi:protein NYNRIN-like [Ictalurus furcatus]|uniref:protein NYNRIN-like n=1 Tax=Ictalurus furcatus TaxID=66913 RepID=UPI0023509252|nr:protein NYNRIN-like [Ictalurus furcatus]